jgi:hypothetical protein
MGVRGKTPHSKRNGVREDNSKKNLRHTGHVNVFHEVDVCVFQGGHLRAWKITSVSTKDGNLLNRYVICIYGHVTI